MDKSSWKRPILLLTYGLVLFFLLLHISEVLKALGMLMGIGTPFLFGAGLAFVLNIPMSFIEKKLFGSKRRLNDRRQEKLKRPVSLVLTLLCASAVIYLVTFLVVPELIHTVGMIAEQIPLAFASFQEWINALDLDWNFIQRNLLEESFDLNTLGRKAADFLQGVLPTVFGSFFFVVSSTISVVTNFVIGFILAVYLLVSKEKLSVQVKKLLYAFLKEQRADRVLYVCGLSYRTFRNFITGQCTEAVILGTMFIISMSILRMPYAVLVGVVIMVTALIPIVGAFIGCAVGVFLILIVSPVKALEFLILFLVLQQVEGNLIYPHVVGSSVGLPSIWVLVSVTVGGGLMGVAGMLLFIPLVSVIYTLVRERMYEKLGEKEVPKEKWEKKV